MELKIKPHHKNSYPVGGFLIKSSLIKDWLSALQMLHMDVSTLDVFPIPDTQPNSVWGCLVVTNGHPGDIGKHEYAQRVTSHIYLGEKSVLFPNIDVEEIDKLLSGNVHVYHPQIGLAALGDPICWEDYLDDLPLSTSVVQKPEPSIFVPMTIQRFQVIPVPKEEIIRQLEETFPQKVKEIEEKPLTTTEKVKKTFLERFFNQKDTDNKSIEYEKSEFLESLERFWGKLTGNEPTFGDNMMSNLEDLEKRNQNELQRLMRMLEEDPDEALRYAIPLDEQGTGRGGQAAELTISPIWQKFNLFGNNLKVSGNGGSVNLGDGFYQLQKKYNDMAQDYIQKKDYHKAAFVYMKLLKNHYKAAETLEGGKCYQEAAAIYLDFVKNKYKAAECYEKGNMMQEAINIFIELNENERVGDLYVQINKRKKADIYYEKVVDNYKLNHQYVKAALIYRNKMLSPMKGQSLLMQGWTENKDAVNCLNNYFSNIDDDKELEKEIEYVYETTLTTNNREYFLQSIKHEFKRKPDFSDKLREMAYHIVSKQATINPKIVSELTSFNEVNTHIKKDIAHFQTKKRK
ncbi:MAG: soluble NSF attachment family protein [Chitinophagales bacterium]|nr:soluble NSF attachment family protein [Chitinophagales bacterium]